MSVIRTSRWLGLLAALSLSSVEAATQEIRALFQPDSSQPNKQLFVNKTPVSGYCATYPDQCAANDMFSIRLPFRFDSTRPISLSTFIGLKVPANWRPLTVTNHATGETETVEVRISGIGSEYILSKPATELVGVPDIPEPRAHGMLWTEKSWVYAAPPCLYAGVGAHTPTNYRFFWKTPIEAVCYKSSANGREFSMSFDTLDIAYELRTPNPLNMSSGLYTGSLSYTLGPSGDFQMGSMMVPNDDNLTLDFVLDVQHTLKVDLPPGGNKVTMEPVGGWQRWIDTGRMPTEIYRDQPFHLSASSRFKVMMVCSSLGGSECDIGNNQVGFSKFEVRLTVPKGVVGPGGADGWTGTLQHNRWLGPFEPSRYVDREPGNLRFQMPRKWIEVLLRPGMNGTLWGNATIIFDSEV